VLGLGGGWFEREHDAFGLDFGAGFGERLDRLDESASLIRRLLGEIITHDGRFHDARRRVSRDPSSALPIIGGSGPTRPRTTARYADLWNIRNVRADRGDQRGPAALRRGRPALR
jgi:alkanesulfonate monooxygenase SsuD/methylene tetrahydromethanopterin reductase-like flavin-dependent oxidoreductase (luciferase family)